MLPNYGCHRVHGHALILQHSQQDCHIAEIFTEILFYASECTRNCGKLLGIQYNYKMTMNTSATKGCPGFGRLNCYGLCTVLRLWWNSS
jgi:hypothetical protein